MPGLPIRTPVDISTVRSVLHRVMDGPNYTPNFRTQAAATLTALAEFILSSNYAGTIDIITINQAGRKGIAFHSHITGSVNLQIHYDQLVQELAAVADEVEYFIGRNHAAITARIWSAD